MALLGMIYNEYTLETNAIGKYSGNNVSVDDALNLKSYTQQVEMHLHQ